jgi:integrase
MTAISDHGDLHRYAGLRIALPYMAQCRPGKGCHSRSPARRCVGYYRQTPIVGNALKEWQPLCAAGDLGLVFPTGRGNVESQTNIIHRFWGPIQIANKMAVDTGRVDAKGGPIMVAQYSLHALRHAAANLFIAHLRWTPKRLQMVLGHSSIRMTFDLYGHPFENLEADMAKIESAVSAA